MTADSRSCAPAATLVHEDGLAAAFARPPEGEPVRGAVVVLGGSGGGLRERDAIAFAQAGFVALALAYFGRPPLAAQLVEVPVETVRRGLEWLIAHPAVQQRRVALVGRSKGGELALLAASSYPDKVSAVVGYVPSPIAWQGVAFDRNARRRGPRSSWTIEGEPVPFLPFLPFSRLRGADMLRVLGMLAGRPAAIAPFYEGSLESAAAADIQRATMPIESIAGPVMLISGSDDQMWPSARFCELAVDRLRAHEHPFPCEHLHYAGAGHLITPPGLAPERSTTMGRFKVGGSEEANAAAGADAWPKVLDLLARAK